MLPTSVYLKRAGVARERRAAFIAPRPQAAPKLRTAPYDLNDARCRRALSRMRELPTSRWNGHVEMTDECMMGLGLFELAGTDYALLNAEIPLKDQTVSRRLRVYPISNSWGALSANVFRTNSDVSISDCMLQRFDDVCVERYISEYILTSQLLRKMCRDAAVESRWLPSFSPPIRSLNAILNTDIALQLRGEAFEIRGALIAQPRTMSQWFVKLLIERVRRGTNTGVGLRTLVYCVAWCARLIQDKDYERLARSAPIIRTWLLQGLCRDCVYKLLRDLREEYAFEYVFNIADSFSKCVTLPDIRTSINVLPCGRESPEDASRQDGFLRTYGRHSFLTSPYANTTLSVAIKVLEDKSPKNFRMTGRQTTSLLLTLDVHARVMRADDWKQGSKVFNAWLAERRANDGNTRFYVLSQIVSDLLAIRNTSVEMNTTVAHLAALMFKGKLNGEMLSAYAEVRKKRADISAHEFIVSYCFLRAPSPDIQHLADQLYNAFSSLSHAERTRLFEFNATPVVTDSEYGILQNDVDLALRWGIQVPDGNDSIDDITLSGLAFYSRSYAPGPDNASTYDLDEMLQEVSDVASVSAAPGEVAEAMVEEGDELPDLESLKEIEDVVDTKSTSFTEYRSPRGISASTSGESSSVIEPDDASSVGYDDALLGYEKEDLS